MQSITIGFSKPKKFKPFAWLIMAGYGTSFDHVYVKLHSTAYNIDIIYQASRTMVNFMGTRIFNRDNDVVDEFEVHITDENKSALMKFCIENAGISYGIKEALGLAIIRIAELFGKKINNPFTDSGATYVCSELAWYILVNFAGVTGDKSYENMSPKDVYQYFKSIRALTT